MLAVSRERDTFCLDFLLLEGLAVCTETACVQRINFGCYLVWDFTLKKSLVVVWSRVLYFFWGVGVGSREGGGTTQSGNRLIAAQHITAADSRADSWLLLQQYSRTLYCLSGIVNSKLLRLGMPPACLSLLYPGARGWSCGRWAVGARCAEQLVCLPPAHPDRFDVSMFGERSHDASDT